MKHETLDGWYSLHLFYVDWATFRLVPEDEREAMINEFKTFINDKASAREQQATMRYIILQVKKRHSIMVLTSRNERT